MKTYEVTFLERVIVKVPGKNPQDALESLDRQEILESKILGTEVLRVHKAKR